MRPSPSDTELLDGFLAGVHGVWRLSETVLSVAPDYDVKEATRMRLEFKMLVLKMMDPKRWRPV